MTNTAAQWGLRALALILGLACGALMLEAALRFAGPAAAWLTSARHPAARSGDVCRILCIGESTTFRQYPEFLAEEIKKQLPALNVTVIDKGRPGTNSSVLASELEGYLNEFRPDVVVAMTGINDLWNAADERFSVRRPGRRGWRTAELFRLFAIGARDLFQRHFSAAPPSAPRAKSAEEFLSGLSEEQKADDFWTACLLAQEYIGTDPGPGPEERRRQTEASLVRAAEDDPLNPRLRARLGSFYMYYARTADMEKTAQTLLSLDPGNIAGYLILAQAAPDAQQARGHLLRALDLAPTQPWHYAEAIQACRTLGLHDRAEAFIRRAMEDFPQKADVWRYELAALRYVQNRVAEARAAVLESPGLSQRDLRAGLIVSYADRLLSPDKDSRDPAVIGRLADKTLENYERMIRLLTRRDVPLVCMQYPLRPVAPLREAFGSTPGVFFVDNEGSFRDGVLREGYGAYFVDNFAGDFGHCTPKGNRLLASNLARVLAGEVLGRGKK